MSRKARKHHYQPDPRINQRIAEEAQLLAEEKWIIDALKKIKAQRNGLQIERLHFESMRSKIIAEQNKSQSASGTSAEKPNLVELTDSQEIPTPQNDTLKSNVSTLMDYNEFCNSEELNLAVSNSIFDNHLYGADCDEEEDEEDMENCLLDMDLLMSGK